MITLHLSLIRTVNLLSFQYIFRLDKFLIKGGYCMMLKVKHLVRSSLKHPEVKIRNYKTFFYNTGSLCILSLYSKLDSCISITNFIYLKQGILAYVIDKFR